MGGTCCCCANNTSTATKPLLSDSKFNNGSTDSAREDKKWSQALQKDARKDKQVKKLLLLGPGNSGKSTFFKQLLRIHGRGLSDFRSKYFGQSDMRRAIYDNILDQIKAVITQCRAFNYELSETEENCITFIQNLPSDVEINKDIAYHIALLWKNESMKLSYDNRSNLSIVDSSSYFFDALQRIAANDYEPTEKDILLVRTPTTGILSSSFEINGNIFHIYDAGGQKCERNKWIHCFDNVTAVIFVASLSCFDQGLYETAFVNAMHESLNLWEEILNSRWFRPTSMILFLNKCDLFKYKLEQKKKDLTVCFSDYEGDNTYKDGIEFVKKVFLDKNKNPNGREIYVHITCATDRNNVEKVFCDVQNIVVNNALQRGGLL